MSHQPPPPPPPRQKKGAAASVTPQANPVESEARGAAASSGSAPVPSQQGNPVPGGAHGVPPASWEDLSSAIAEPASATSTALVPVAATGLPPEILVSSGKIMWLPSSPQPTSSLYLLFRCADNKDPLLSQGGGLLRALFDGTALEEDVQDKPHGQFMVEVMGKYGWSEGLLMSQSISAPPLQGMRAMGIGSNVQVRRKASKMALALAILAANPSGYQNVYLHHTGIRELVAEALEAKTRSQHVLLSGGFAALAPGQPGAADGWDSQYDALPLPPAAPTTGPVLSLADYAHAWEAPTTQQVQQVQTPALPSSPSLPLGAEASELRESLMDFVRQGRLCTTWIERQQWIEQLIYHPLIEKNVNHDLLREPGMVLMMWDQGGGLSPVWPRCYACNKASDENHIKSAKHKRNLEWLADNHPTWWLESTEPYTQEQYDAMAMRSVVTTPTPIAPVIPPRTSPHVPGPTYTAAPPVPKRRWPMPEDNAPGPVRDTPAPNLPPPTVKVVNTLGLATTMYIYAPYLGKAEILEDTTKPRQWLTVQEMRDFRRRYPGEPLPSTPDPDVLASEAAAAAAATEEVVEEV